MVDAVSATSAASAQNDEARTTLAETYDTFLILLTEQLKNQDPLEPLDSSEFTSQLVEYSNVEQQILQNEQLTELISIQRSSETGTAVDFLGKEVAYNSPLAYNDGTGAQWNIGLPSDVSEANVSIVAEDGRVVFTSALPIGADELDWDGLDNAGNPVPPGIYSLEVSATDLDGNTLAGDITGTGTVSSVDLAGETASVSIGGLTIPFANVTNVRQPGPTSAVV